MCHSEDMNNNGYLTNPVYTILPRLPSVQLEIAQSEQDVSPFCKESDMTYS